MTSPRITTLNLPAGIHTVAADDYHADRLRPEPTLSSTLARTILSQSPRHAWTAHPRLNPAHESKNSKVFDFGRAAHRTILGAGGDYAVIPEDLLSANGALSTKEAKAWVAEQREAGVTPIKQDDADKLEAMAGVMAAALREIGLTLDPARSELTALAPVEGVWCRAMIDNAPVAPVPLGGLPTRLMLDFKTTENASPEACVNSVRSYGYDVQAAHYLETWRAATGEERTFLFLFQEKTAPFEVCAVRLLSNPGHSEDWMLTARDKARTARRLWADCLASGDWPGYRREVHEIGAPAWHNTRWDESPVRAEVASRPAPALLKRVTDWQSPQGLTA